MKLTSKLFIGNDKRKERYFDSSIIALYTKITINRNGHIHLGAFFYKKNLLVNIFREILVFFLFFPFSSDAFLIYVFSCNQYAYQPKCNQQFKIRTEIKGKAWLEHH